MMPERTIRKPAALLVSLDFGQPSYQESVEEFKLLVESAGFVPRIVIQGKRQEPTPALFAGSGKVKAIALRLREEPVDVVIFNHDISPVQERNLEKELSCKVMDRTRLILDIFARRARSHEGKLQVELAQLEHLSTRLVRGWTHLERQRGGIGLRGGPGETQLEVDRRLIAERVKVLKRKLGGLQRRREVQRRARQRNQIFSISIVGYTNAGKSTLFNALTRSETYAANQLFATLDTTSRKLYVPEIESSVIVSDTVGFIRDLPHALIAAFQATLEETAQANLLLHVVDSSSTNQEQEIIEVNKVLSEIGAAHLPQIIVGNKIDLVPMLPNLEKDEYGKIARVRISAKTGAGLPLLKQALVEAIKSRIEDRARTMRNPVNPVY